MIEWNENDGKTFDTLDGKTLVDFYATWCGPCRTMSRIIDQYSEKNPDIRIVKVDTDKNPNLSAKFEIMSIPTLLVLDGGEVKERIVGVTSESELDSKLK